MEGSFVNSMLGWQLEGAGGSHQAPSESQVTLPLRRTWGHRAAAGSRAHVESQAGPCYLPFLNAETQARKGQVLCSGSDKAVYCSGFHYDDAL